MRTVGPVERVISGGQSGVDLAALRAAKAAGLSTGGCMPRGWRTLDGPRPEYAREFGMVEHDLSNYPARTFRNVRDAEATLRIAVDFESEGEKCTWNAIVRHRRPNFSVLVEPPGYSSIPSAVALSKASLSCANYLPAQVAEWIYNTRIRVLNVAGNSEHTAPGIGAFAERYLARVFDLVEQISSERRDDGDGLR